VERYGTLETKSSSSYIRSLSSDHHLSTTLISQFVCSADVVSVYRYPMGIVILNNSQERLGEVSGLIARLSWVTCSEQFTILKIQYRSSFSDGSVSDFRISAVGKLKDWHNCAISRQQGSRFNATCRKTVCLKRSRAVLDIELLVQPYSVDYQLMYWHSVLYKNWRSSKTNNLLWLLLPTNDI
jgi:hypothetical protein